MVTLELDFSWCPFWIQVHELPIDKLTKTHEEIIWNRIGQLIKVELIRNGSYYIATSYGFMWM
ncbi:hypothetical protein ACSBR2_023730 [Camellia fascicularis]